MVASASKHTVDLTQGSVTKQLIAFFIPHLLHQPFAAALHRRHAFPDRRAYAHGAGVAFLRGDYLIYRSKLKKAI